MGTEERCSRSEDCVARDYHVKWEFKIIPEHHLLDYLAFPYLSIMNLYNILLKVESYLLESLNTSVKHNFLKYKMHSLPAHSACWANLAPCIVSDQQPQTPAVIHLILPSGL